MLFLTSDLSKGIHALTLFRPRSVSQADCYLASEKKIERDLKSFKPITCIIVSIEKLSATPKNLLSRGLVDCLIAGSKEFNVINIQTSGNFAGGRNYGSSLRPNWSRIGGC